MAPSLAERALGFFASLVCRFPLAFICPQVLLAGVCVWYTVDNLEFHTQRNDLVDSSRTYHRDYLEYRKNFESQDDLLIMVESGDPEKNRQFVERLGARLENEPELFTSVFYKGNLSMLGSKALYFVEESSIIETMEERLREARPIIESLDHIDSLESLLEEINLRFRTASEENREDLQPLLDALPVLERILSQADASITRPGIPPSPGVEMLFAGGPEAERQRYLAYDWGRTYLITARPVTRELEKPAVRRLEELVDQVRAEVSGINVGITGAAVLSLDEMRQSGKDTLKASCISLLLVLIIFATCYREIERPILATLCLLFGLAYAMAYTTLMVGHLNILTIAFLPMLIGLAIDFGIHLITRYEEELARDHSHRESLHKALVRTGKGIFSGCLTTAGAFFAMTLTEFKGIREMGIITSGGLLLSLYPMMTAFPGLLLCLRRKPSPRHIRSRKRLLRSNVEQVWLRRPATTVGVAAVLTILALTQLPRLRFDYNLLNMQSPNLPSVLHEMKFLEITDKSVLFALVIADSLEEARRLEQGIAQLPSVSGVDSLTRFLDIDPPGRREAIERLAGEARAISLADPRSEPVDLERLSRGLSFFQGYLTLAARNLEEERPEDPLIEQFRSLGRTALRLQNSMGRAPEGLAIRQLSDFERALFDDIRRTLSTIASQDSSRPPAVEDLPANLRNRFIGRTGQHLLMVYPKENVWEREHQTEFLEELRTLAAGLPDPPVITGTPVQLYEYTSLLKRSYEQAALYALGVIVFILFLHFHHPLTVLLAMLPVGIGALWLVGVMGLFDIPFNPANIMTLPLVVGIGVTNGIHILNRYSEERHPGLLSKSTGKGVLVSGLTTMAGFGSLTLAHHRGIESLGQVMTLGVFSCMIAGLTLLPCILMLFLEREGNAAR